MTTNTFFMVSARDNQPLHVTCNGSNTQGDMCRLSMGIFADYKVNMSDIVNNNTAFLLYEIYRYFLLP